MIRSAHQTRDIDEPVPPGRPGDPSACTGLPAAVAEPPDPEPPDFESYAAARQHHLYRTAYLLCGDRDRAQDLVQTTLVALLRSWRKARLAENPDAYAKKALVRAFLTEQRKLRRSVSAHAFLRAEPGSAATAADPAELRLVVLDALRALPPKPRTMIILRYWEDLSVEETAALLGCSTGNVKSQCSRSLAKLRELLGDRFTELSEP
ncbi:SigE family RNA polymerase sigma factor [Actinocrinis sp.]|uniref:SigE family RNA polymerase sigma factor n=1 Tax=Actinocrinis sp. TaxID=1920516 RepID=UPI002D5FB7EC|nr:SigE family RNA polymerase sigma factor [Actinocrinis sp.]HZP54575.1 SigE family RNA polymerase sigma factor [Actinocrinis sp.]